ncbi:MAG: heme exporter protein CcmD [Burkholderiaceae bacterium]|jgi:heme exporter protein D|nr:heme exporter protein CcmD [Burkholderiaceae bacterium]MCU0929363.1 heme exporter protein CcmD [Burkholderiaceae bacterium]
MTWGSWAEFFAMGGHAPFVWGSFGVTALVIAAELLGVRARRRTLRTLAAQDEPDAGDVDAQPEVSAR